MKEHAEDQEGDVKQQQHHVFVGRHLRDGVAERLRQLRFGQKSPDQSGGRDKQHHHRRLDATVDAGLAQDLQVDVAIDHATDHQCCEHSHAGAFGGSDDAAEDTAENGHRQDEGPGCVFEGAPDMADAEALLDREIEFDRLVVGDGRHAECA